MNALKTLQTVVSSIAAIAVAGLPAHASQGDDTLNQTVSQFSSPGKRGAWTDPDLPTADAAPSGDARMSAMLAVHTRATLDRGGWANPFVADDHYAAGEPLLAAVIGGGVTSRGQARPQPARQLAAR